MSPTPLAGPWIIVVYAGKIDWGLKLITVLHLDARLRMSGVIPPYSHIPSWRKNESFILLEAFAKIFRKRLLANSCLTVCLSLRMEQLVSQWTDFHEI